MTAEDVFNPPGGSSQWGRRWDRPQQPRIWSVAKQALCPVALPHPQSIPQWPNPFFFSSHVKRISRFHAHTFVILINKNFQSALDILSWLRLLLLLLLLFSWLHQWCGNCRFTVGSISVSYVWFALILVRISNPLIWWLAWLFATSRRWSGFFQISQVDF